MQKWCYSPILLIWHFSTVWRESSNMSWKKYEQLANYPREILTGKIAPEGLSAPKTGGDLSGGWVPVHERIVRYLLCHVVWEPLKRHFEINATVLSGTNRD